MLSLAFAAPDTLPVDQGHSLPLVAAMPSPLLLPFTPGEPWYVCQGYKGTITHRNAYALDLTVRQEDVGNAGCWANDGNVNASEGREVTAPASGTVIHIGTDLVCIDFDAGGSMLIGHLTGRVAGGHVDQNARLGWVASANAATNGGYAHIHVQIHLGPGCRAGGPTVPFDDAHGTRFQGAPNLPDKGGTNQHKGVPLTKGGVSPCPAPTLTEPADGAVLSSRTITFRWNTVSGCKFDGYTFRIKNVPTMDSGGTTIRDTGEGGTQRTETIDDWDNTDLYWGVKAANASAGANWAVRRFRYVPRSGPSDGGAVDVMLIIDSSGCIT
jgi:hypothetical protein